MQIAEGVYRIRNAIVNLYLIQDFDGNLHLIDAGLPGSLSAIRRVLESNHLDLQRLKNVYLTHADGDHYGGLSALYAQLPDLQVWADPVEAQAIRSGGSSRVVRSEGVMATVLNLVRPLMKTDAARVDHLIADGDTLPVRDGLKVIATPGHTPGHLSYYLPAQGILFSGDSIARQGQRLIPSHGGNTWDLDVARRSYELQARLESKMLAGGHCFVGQDAKDYFHLI